MAELLAPVTPYIEKGLFESVRVSTRPDAIDEERLRLLRRFGVTTVELGAQSMDDEVLRLSRRGHGAGDTVRASRLLKERGFQVGIQLMPGLPGDSKAGWRKSIEDVTRLRPDMVRLYPTVVIRGTDLARWYLEKRYRPLGLREAVEACQEGCIRFEENGIPVIRLGLMASPALLEHGRILAGPWHNAFGHLVRSAVYHERLELSLPVIGFAKQVRLRAPARDIPLLRGYQNQGLRRLEKRIDARITAVQPDEALASGTIGVDRQ
jgi:histone acetyltransferase (RNA polymerase elongator complex component)